MPWARSGVGLLVMALVIDHVLTLCCLVMLARASRQDIGERGLIAATVLHPLVTGPCLASMLRPGQGWIAATAIPMAGTLAGVVLWPGLGLVAVLGMAGLSDELGSVLNRRGFWRSAE